MNGSKTHAWLLLAALALAGCAGQIPSRWGFRQEDRAQVVELTSKLEAVTANLLDHVRQPLNALRQSNEADLTSVRFFASEVKRFRQTVADWQQNEAVGIGYSTLTGRWTTMREQTARGLVSSDIRNLIERINELMMSLGRYATADAARAVAPTGR